MARSRKKPAAGAPSRRGGGAPKQRSTSRKAAAATASVEVVEEEKGMGLDEGIVLATTLALVAAIVLVEIGLQKFFDAGAFG